LDWDYIEDDIARGEADKKSIVQKKKL